VRIRLKFLGAVRANSMAVLLPIPDEAPVITIVFPSRRLLIAEDAMLRREGYASFGGKGILRGAFEDLSMCLAVRREIIRCVDKIVTGKREKAVIEKL
jgi:hypothetical protein